MLNNKILPEAGLMSVAELAQTTEINVNTLTRSLEENNILILKLGSFKKNWYVSLRKLAEVAACSPKM
jgi:DNA-binding transcriptional regulator YhcF (GntR family)